MGIWKKNNQKSIVDKCASHVTFFIQALSLELAAPAIIEMYICICNYLRDFQLTALKRQFGNPVTNKWSHPKVVTVLIITDLANGIISTPLVILKIHRVYP